MMQMYFISKRLKTFSAAHRLIKSYQGKCRTLHGHNYHVDITLEANTLDDSDLVLDFSQITKTLNAFILEKLDHAIITNASDQSLCDFINSANQKAYLLPGDENSSVEVIAKHLYHQFQSLLTDIAPNHVKLTSVRVFESEHASAMYTE